MERDGTMAIHKVFVVGASIMGSGIAQVCAQSGMRVVLNDISAEAAERGRGQCAWQAVLSAEGVELQGLGDHNALGCTCEVVLWRVVRAPVKY